MEVDDTFPSLLFMIIDTDTYHWKSLEKHSINVHKINYSNFIKILISFCNSFASLHKQNKIVIISKNSYSIDSVYPPEIISTSPEDIFDMSKLKLSAINCLAQTGSLSEADGQTSMSQAFNKALCGKNIKL